MAIGVALSAGMAPGAGVKNAVPETAGSMPHKALYDFKVISIESGSGINDVRGQMYYEQDDVCDAWTAEHRFTVEYHYPERQPILNTSHYVAWEAKDHLRFHFSSERQENGEMVEQLRGAVVKKEDTSAVAEYARPDDLSFELPAGYVLPMQHTAEILRHARQGKTFFNAVMFDGTDAEGPLVVNTFIGRKATPAEIAALVSGVPAEKLDAGLLKAGAWHVRLALFPLEDAEGMMPAYEMDLILHDNGVISHAIVDYKSFKLEQKISALEKLPARNCHPEETRP